MLQSFKNSSWREKAQSMIEFALIFPLLLVLLYGIIEFGRLMYIYVSVTTSSREAARYGSAVGTVGGVPRYLDCSGIADAARRSAILNSITVDDTHFRITYDHGPQTVWVPSITCATGQNATFNLGDRIVVRVTVDYAPLIPIVHFASFPISSTTSRTILTSVEVLGTPAPDKPYVSFEILSQAGTETELDTPAKTIYAVLSYADSSEITVFFSFAGTATKGQDYTYTETLNFAPGQTRLPVARVINDPYDEYAETIEITIIEATGAIIDDAKKHHVTTILDTDTDDPTPTVQFMLATQDVLEDQAVFVIVTLSEMSGKDITVPFTPSGTAQYTVDYTLNPATLSFHFPPMSGKTQQIAFLATKDNIDEEDFEDAFLTLGAPTNATLGVPITDDVRIQDIDPPPNVSFEMASQKVVEGVPGTIKVLLNTITTKVVTVPFSVTDAAVNGATKNVDYTVSTTSPLTIPPGSLEAEIQFNILKDVLDEPDETFSIDFGAVTNAIPVDPTQHVVTILGTALPPIVNFEASKTVSESAGAVQIRFWLDHSWTQPVTVAYSIGGGTAVNGADYSAATTGIVTIPIGAQYGSFTVNIIDDTLYEDNETIIFNMGAVTNGTQGTTKQHVLTILDNDYAPYVNFEIAAQTGMEDGGPMTARIVLDAVTTKNVIVPFTVSGTATRGKDYTITSSPVTIPAGSLSADIVITVLDDTIPGEGDETVIITLGTPTNGQLGTQISHTATIRDNEICPSLNSRNIQPGQGMNYFTIGLLYPDLTQPTIYISNLVVDWNSSGGQKLQRIDWIGKPIFNDSNGTSSNPLSLPPFAGTQSDREYAPSTSERLLVVYFKNPMTGVPDDYRVSITFNNGCTVP